MDPITLALIGAGVQVASSLIGQLLASGDREAAAEALREASKLYDDVPLPGYEDFKEQTLGPSAMESLNVDPRYKEAQLQTDARLRELGESGGMLLSDRVAQNEAMGSINRDEQAARGRILDRMRRSGQAGGGAETAALLTSQQGQANRASDVGMKTAANAESRALDAILQRGKLGGQMRDQEFGEQSEIARAKDEIQRFNAAARERGVMSRNQIASQRFSDDMSLRNARYGARRDRAQGQQREAQGTQDMWGGIGAGLGQAVNGLGNFANPDAKPGDRPWWKI